jgi:hypothetical protein
VYHYLRDDRVLVTGAGPEPPLLPPPPPLLTRTGASINGLFFCWITRLGAVTERSPAAWLLF